MVWVAGIDEAGRGPVLGSMIVCAYACAEESQDELKKLGVKDSKLLSAEKRRDLYGQILSLGKASIVECTAADLNAAMLRRSLNDIEAQAMATALTQLEKNNPTSKTKKQNKAAPAFESVFIDTPDPTLATYERRLKRFYKGSANLVCRHKADTLFPVVSAASVLAKVTRDAGIERLKAEFGEDFGSGYSHDERTIAFLQKHWTNKSHPMHAHVRQQWATAKNLSIRQFKLDGFI